MLEIRKTRPEELPRLLAIFAQARAFMRMRGNPDQWGNSRPTEQTIRDDIAAGCSYVCLNGGEIAATFCYWTGEEPTYRAIWGGGWLDDRPYGVVHRIASAGTVRGAAGYCLDWCLAQCGNLRIDTHRDNAPMRRLLEKRGFTYCGIIHLADGAERLAYQRTHF